MFQTNITDLEVSTYPMWLCIGYTERGGHARVRANTHTHTHTHTLDEVQRQITSVSYLLSSECYRVGYFSPVVPSSVSLYNNYEGWLSVLTIHSFLWDVQNATIPCRSQELLPFLSVTYFFLPLFSTNYSSIRSHLILPSISWSTSQSCCSQIHM